MKAAGLPEQDFPKGVLYVVGLPIGNLGDITLRAIWLLARADAVAAEDTRETKKVLERFGLTPRLISVREHNERHGAEQILAMLAQGERVAMVTDAGTPAISDPGARVVDAVRAAGVRVIPLPGASAVVTAMSAAGLLGDGFRFVGFVPPQPKARRAALASLAAYADPFVLYEAPHRIVPLLMDLAEALGSGRRVVIARELTKKFETIVAVDSAELEQWAAMHEPRGEYVILVDEAAEQPLVLDETQRRWLDALAELLPASRLSAAAAKATGLSRQLVYEYLLTKKEAD